MSQTNVRNGGLLALRTAGALLLARGFRALFEDGSLGSGMDPILDGAQSSGLPMPEAAGWVVAGIALLGGLAVTIGIFTRFAAVLCALATVVAVTPDDAGDVLLELRVAYIAAFVAIAMLGPGKWSGDGKWRGAS